MYARKQQLQLFVLCGPTQHLYGKNYGKKNIRKYLGDKSKIWSVVAKIIEEIHPPLTAIFCEQVLT